MTEAGDLKRILDAERNAEGIEVVHRRERRSLYSSAAGSPMLRPSVVAYLDVLGTKDRSSRLAVEQLRSDIEDIDDWQSGLHSEFWDASRQRFVSFSDNVAVAAPFAPGALNDVLQHQLDAVASFQLQKVLSGRGLRGGIVMGDVFCDGTYIDGPALVEGVSLEEKHADVPRVILDDALQEAVRTAWSPGEAKIWPNQLVAIDLDGRAFVNYLIEVKPRTESASPILTRHREAVEQQLATASSARTEAKWRWVAEYHNWFVQQWSPGEVDLFLDASSQRAIQLL